MNYQYLSRRDTQSVDFCCDDEAIINAKNIIDKINRINSFNGKERAKLNRSYPFTFLVMDIEVI